MNPIVFFGLVILSLFFIFIGYQYKVEKTKLNKEEDIEDKEYESNRINIRNLISSLFAVIGAGEYGLAITLVIIYGFWGTSFLVGLAVALILIATSVNRIWREKASLSNILPKYDGYKSLTTPDYIYAKFGRIASIPATIITASAFWGLIVLQFVVGGELISAIAHTKIEISIILMFVVITAYTLLGGFSAIFHTDFWQKVFMWIGLITAIIYTTFFHDSPIHFSDAFQGYMSISKDSITVNNLIKDPNIIVLFLITVAAAFGGPDLWQRVNMAKSKKEAKQGAKYASLSIIIFAIVISFLGIDIWRSMEVIKQTDIQQTDTFLAYINYISSSYGNWSDEILLLFSIGLISAFISTADTSLMLVLTSIENELLRKNKTSIEINKWKKIVLIVLISTTAALFSMFTTDIAKTFTAVLGILGVMGVPVFFSLYNIGNKVTAFIAMILGLILVVLANYVFPEFNDGYYLLIPFIPGFLSLLVIKRER